MNTSFRFCSEPMAGPIVNPTETIKLLHRLLIVTLTVLLVVLPMSELAGQEMPVPVSLQVRLFAKILAYDRSLQDTRGEGLSIGVLYQGRFRTSRGAKDQFVEAVSHAEVNGSGPLRCVAIDVTESATIASAIDREAVDILYVTPLRAFDLAELAQISRAQDILTLTGVPDYVESLAVGIGSKGGRPLILINQDAAKEEGANFSAELLKLAQLIN